MSVPFLRPITVWERWAQDDKTKEWFWDFNHIENGHCPNAIPTPLFEVQERSWSKGTWRKYFVFLTEQNVVISLV